MHSTASQCETAQVAQASVEAGELGVFEHSEAGNRARAPCRGHEELETGRDEVVAINFATEAKSRRCNITRSIVYSLDSHT